MKMKTAFSHLFLFATGCFVALPSLAADGSSYVEVAERGAPVTSSPYIGTLEHTNQLQLFASLSDIGEDYYLLKQRQNARERARAVGMQIPDHPLVDISGVLDASAFYESPYRQHHTSDINLNDTDLEVIGEINNWATTFVGFNYDSTLRTDSAQRIANSRVIIEKGMLILGDLERSPFYGSIGQLYIPFGDYGSRLVSDPLAINIGRTRTRALSLGYHQADAQAFYGNLYAFQGDSRVGAAIAAVTRPRNDKINQWGANLGHKTKLDQLTFDIRAGWIASLTDALGMQVTSSSGFGGFAQSSATEVLHHRVPGGDLFFNLDRGPYSVSGEWVGAMQDFHGMDMSFDGRAAKPQSWHLEAAYRFPLLKRPASAVIGYDRTKEALALGLPEQRVLAALNYNFLRDTLASLEIRHDHNYGSHHTATGAGTPIGGLNELGQERTRLTIFLQYQF